MEKYLVSVVGTTNEDEAQQEEINLIAEMEED